jgi:hypothetical protein
MHNVLLHVDDGIVLDVRTLLGSMIATDRNGVPAFDDPRSYLLEVAEGDVFMDTASLTNLMNRHVWNYDGAPLSDTTIVVDGNELKQTGKLHKGVTVPFSMKATVSATPDGRMRLHTESASALGVPAKKLMEIFGLSLGDVVKVKEQRGIDIEGDDVVISPGQVLPPPELRGRLSTVEIADGKLHQVFGAPGEPAGARPSASEPHFPNYLRFSGSTIKFGKLTMRDTDLMLIDADPRDPFDFFPLRYMTQLAAGYSKTTATGGLRAYLPDFDDVMARPGLDLTPGH